MERRVATVLFVDIVGSTELVAGADPEVVRSRLSRFFAQISHCIDAHGGFVEKYAGDAVMAVFGLPAAHEDDPERAVRAALAILDAVEPLGLEVRIGVETGEIVADEEGTGFATGIAINAAARLQQAAQPGELLIGPGTERLTRHLVSTVPLGTKEARGFKDGVEAWRVLSIEEAVGRRLSVAVPLVGREEELELLHNTFARAVRDERVHLVTVYGAPGVGKSRLMREFTDGVERSTILFGRCLPYGEGVTYWAIAEMVKAAAGITDDDTVDAATEKLRACCGDGAVADLLALASGVLDAVGGERSASEIAWAAQTWATELADLQPLVLVFEDIHWAEEPMLDLIEHLARGVRDVPLLILCLARPDLLDERPAWGGGRVRAAAIELEALPRDEGARLVEALAGGEGIELDDERLEAVLDTTDGNPLFIEETVRMFAESGSEPTGIPPTVQAMISARIDRLPPAERKVLRRASVAGRVFWTGAIAAIGEDDDSVEDELEELLDRDFVVREPRSTIRGEEAFRFKHVLIRDVAYAGLSKSSRALLHRQMADWLAARGAADDLVEIRAYHLDEAAQLQEELEGAVAADLAGEAAAALEQAGKRAHAREANRAARRLLLRSVELEPTLERRYLAARAAWRMTDMPTVSAEMAAVQEEAHAAGDRRIESRALVVLSLVALYRDADTDAARRLAGRALAAAEPDDDVARFDALEVLANAAWWEGDLDEVERIAAERLAIAERIGRTDLQVPVVLELADIHNHRLDTAGARELLERAEELTADSSSLTIRGWTMRAAGRQALLDGRLDDAERSLEEARRLFSESGAALTLGRTLNYIGIVAVERGDLARAESTLREAIRVLTPTGDRGTLVESQRLLAQVLLAEGRVDDAERLALAALETVGSCDAGSISTTRLALGLVRAAQGRDDDAEQLLRDADDAVVRTGYRRHRIAPLEELSAFLRERGRADEAVEADRTLAELRREPETATLG